MNFNIAVTKNYSNETSPFNSPRSKTEDITPIDLNQLLQDYGVSYEKLGNMVGHRSIPFAKVFDVKVTDFDTMTSNIVETFHKRLKEHADHINKKKLN